MKKRRGRSPIVTQARKEAAKADSKELARAKQERRKKKRPQEGK